MSHRRFNYGQAFLRVLIPTGQGSALPLHAQNCPQNGQNSPIHRASG
ncbi:MAG: hypothetical protein KJ043_00310 [Anaerolineae bacterium]|nr:hypothetical protein [Anaerolineae bacterium]